VRQRWTNYIVMGPTVIKAGGRASHAKLEHARARRRLLATVGIPYVQISRLWHWGRLASGVLNSCSGSDLQTLPGRPHGSAGTTGAATKQSRLT